MKESLHWTAALGQLIFEKDMFSIQALTRKLLHRPPVSGDVLPRHTYTTAPLVKDIATLASPDRPVSDTALLNLAAKYFHAYVHPGSEQETLSLESITLAFNQFIHRRHGFDGFDGCHDLRLRMLETGFALCMLADLAKTAHIVRAIVNAPVMSPKGNEPYKALDIGTGSGILMLAEYIQARRNGYERTEITGIERDERVCKRTNELVAALGIGNVILADAKQPASYSLFSGRPIHFIANETLPSKGRSMWKEDFGPINQALFTVLEPELRGAAFFPEAVIALHRRGKQTLVLDRDNQFHKSEEYPLRLMKAEGLVLEGEIMQLDEVGEPLKDLVPPSWQPHLATRW